MAADPSAATPADASASDPRRVRAREPHRPIDLAAVCGRAGVGAARNTGRNDADRIYLPGVGRQELGAAQTCPDHLKPLVELQYRGTCWTQRNGRDWTVEAFLVSGDGGLGLDLARDAATRQSMLRALAELATASVQGLEGRRLEAEDFDRLFSDDPVRDVLTWLGNGGAMPLDWDTARWDAFASRCKADFGFDPGEDGELVAAERLGLREGPWESVWRRFAEAPALYPGVSDLLRMAMPNDLFVEPSSWPATNEKGEADLQRALLALGGEARTSCTGAGHRARAAAWSLAATGSGRSLVGHPWRMPSNTWRSSQNARRTISVGDPRRKWPNCM